MVNEFQIVRVEFLIPRRYIVGYYGDQEQMELEVKFGKSSVYENGEVGGKLFDCQFVVPYQVQRRDEQLH